MNRRNVLIGLGSITTGAGAVFGSGAFTQVQADRSANFTVAADSSANLGLEGDGSYVSQTTEISSSSNTVEFQFDSLNDTASSTFADVLTITNNTQDGNSKNVYVQDDGTVTAGGVIDFLDGNGNSRVGSANAVSLAAGGSVTLDIVIDTSAGDPSTVDTITIVGEA